MTEVTVPWNDAYGYGYTDIHRWCNENCKGYWYVKVIGRDTKSPKAIIQLFDDKDTTAILMFYVGATLLKAGEEEYD